MQAIGGAIEEFDRRYSAFISYRHVARDRQWAKWLVETLESYRTPKALVKKGFAARIGPMYRDEDENPASAELGDQIEKALAASDTLIVVASRDTPGSSWIDREVRLFQEMGKGDRILVLLVDGDPAQSYPPSLLRDPDKEPIAADVRLREDEPERLLKHRAKLRIAAALLRCAYDDLAQRDRQRTRRRRTSIGAGSAVALLLAGLTVFGIAQQREILRLDRTALNIQNELRGASSNAPEKEFAMFAALSDSAWPYVRVTPKARDLMLRRARLAAIHQMHFWPGSRGATMLTSLADGQVAVGAGDGSLYLSSPNQLRRILPALECHNSAEGIQKCAVSAIAGNGRQIAAGSAGGVLRILEAAGGSTETIVLGANKIDRLLWLPNGQLLVADDGGALTLVTPGRPPEILPTPLGAIAKLISDRAGKTIIVRTSGRIEQLLPNGQVTSVAEYGAVVRDAWLVDGKLLLFRTAINKGFGETSGRTAIFWGAFDSAKAVDFDKDSVRLTNEDDQVLLPIGDGPAFFHGSGTTISRGNLKDRKLEWIDIDMGFDWAQNRYFEFQHRGSMALSPNRRWLYSVNKYSGAVFVIDLEKLEKVDRLFAESRFLKRDLCEAGIAPLFAARSGENQRCP